MNVALEYKMNFVVVISDTLRRDHLPCYGNQQIYAPNIARFAAESVVFDGCRPASFPTVPARADIMTGRNTFIYQDWGPLPGEHPTLAQTLSSHGYLTAGVVDTPFYLRNGYGYDRGFHDFQWIRGQRQGPERNDVQAGWRGEEDHFAPATFGAATRWLERHQDERFFLCVDTWDPHEPWDPPAHYVRRYFPDYKGEHVSPCYWDWRDFGYSERDVEIAHACYMGEISMVDRWFGVLVDRLASLNILEDTAVFLVADHGFYFGEHGQLGKSRFRWQDGVGFEEGWSRGLKVGYIHRSPLHNEVTRVPLLARLPGVAPRRVSGLVSLPDLMPTILDLAGASKPESIQGSSFVPLINGDSDKVHDLVVTSATLHNPGSSSRMVDDQVREIVEGSPSTITDGEWDLLYSTAGEPVELYRTAEDYGHQHNLVADNLEVAERMHQWFYSWLESLGASAASLAARKTLSAPD